MKSAALEARGEGLVYIVGQIYDKIYQKGNKIDLGGLMNDSDSPLKHNPFTALGKLLKDKAILRPVPIIKPVVSTKGRLQSLLKPVPHRLTKKAPFGRPWKASS